MNYSENRRMKILIMVGIVIAVIGAAAEFFVPEEQGVLSRAAFICSSAGVSLVLMGAAVLLRRSRMSPEQARARDLAMGDERGVMIAYKAQSLMALAAVLALVAILIVASVRGDDLYRNLCTAACFTAAAVKLAAWYWYNKRM